MKKRQQEPEKNLTEDQYMAVDFIELMEYIDAIVKFSSSEDREYISTEISERATELRMYFMAILFPKKEDK